MEVQIKGTHITIGHDAAGNPYCVKSGGKVKKRVDWECPEHEWKVRFGKNGDPFDKEIGNGAGKKDGDTVKKKEVKYPYTYQYTVSCKIDGVWRDVDPDLIVDDED